MFTNKFPGNPGRTLREEAGISLCYIRRLFSKSGACLPAHTCRRTMCAYAHVCPNTHGCTMKRPTVSVTLKKCSPAPLFNISLAIRLCARASTARAHANSHRVFSTKTACKFCLETERWEEGYSFASIGHFPWQPHPDVSQSEETCVAH